MHSKMLLVIALLLSTSLAAQNEKTPIYSGNGVEVNMLSNYESGTRLHAAGNIPMAITMFKQGAEKGEPKSIFALGTYYYFGEGVEQDLVQARELFLKASAQGHAESTFMLSLIYGRGEGVAADQKIAMTYLQTAARACVSQAQNQLAQMYYEGYVVEKDPMKGIAWLALAAEHDGEETRETVKQIKADLSPKDLARVEELETQHRSTLTCATD